MQTSAPIQAQVKLSLAQDGSVIIQRPVFPAQGPALTISQSQQVDGSQQVTIPMVNFTTATTTPTSNMAAISVSAQPVQSVLLQRLNSAPNVQPQTPVSQAQVPSQPQQQLTTSPTTNTATSVIPLAIQGINVNLVHSFNATPSSTVVPSAGMVPATSVYSQPVVTMSTVSSSANTILSSMLSQTHPMLAHTLAQDSQMMPESSSNGSKQSVGNVISNGTKIVNQSPLLVQSLQTLGGQNLSPLTHLPVSSASTSVVSSSTTVTAMSSSTVTTTLSTTTTTNCNASLDSLVNSSVLQSAPLAIAEPSQVTHATAVSNSSLTIPASLSSTVLTPNVTLKSPAPSLIVAGYPFSGLQPGQKVQTIQLTTQGQEVIINTYQC